MLTNEAFNSSSNNDTLTEAEQLVCSIANVDPDLVLNHHEMWIDDSVRTDSKVYTDFHDHFYSQYCDFERFRSRAVLISDRKHYELINKLARAMLCRMPLDQDEPYYSADFLSDQDHDNAIKLITAMHNDWLYDEEPYIFIPEVLSPEKKQIIEGLLQTIKSLDLKNESEGTMAHLLYDYIQQMIVYDAALLYTYGAEIEDVQKDYGDYARWAFNHYCDLIDDLQGHTYDTIPQYVI